MGTFLLIVKYATLVPTLVGIINAGINFVESVKADAPGPEKKQAVIDGLRSMWEDIASEAKIKEPFDVFEPLISRLIDFAVAIYNVIGHFTHKDAGATS